MNNTNTINDPLMVEKSIIINAPAAKVWDALTNPDLIKKYFFGTNTITDWKIGSPIIFKGEWEGKEYVDKGVIKDIESEKLIRYTYWSSISGKEDKPENYANVSYILSPAGNGTQLTVTQDGSKTPEVRDHSASNWQKVLDGIKKMLENN